MWLCDGTVEFNVVERTRVLTGLEMRDDVQLRDGLVQFDFDCFEQIVAALHTPMPRY